MTLFPIQNLLKVNLANLYHFGKFFFELHKEIKWNRDIPYHTCACEVRENITLIIRGLNPNLPEKLPEDLYKVIDKFICNKENHTNSCNLQLLAILNASKKLYEVMFFDMQKCV